MEELQIQGPAIRYIENFNFMEGGFSAPILHVVQGSAVFGWQIHSASG